MNFCQLFQSAIVIHQVLHLYILVIFAIVPTSLRVPAIYRVIDHLSSIPQTDHHQVYNHQLVVCNEAQRFEGEVLVVETKLGQEEKLELIFFESIICIETSLDIWNTDLEIKTIFIKCKAQQRGRRRTFHIRPVQSTLHFLSCQLRVKFHLFLEEDEVWYNHLSSFLADSSQQHSFP